MRKRYSRSYTVLSFLTMFSYRELPFVMSFFLSGGFNSDIFGQGPQIVAGANERAPIYKKSEQVICSLLRRAIT